MLNWTPMIVYFIGSPETVTLASECLVQFMPRPLNSYSPIQKEMGVNSRKGGLLFCQFLYFPMKKIRC
jgi:hypothetical protein